jgi:hypothetical protein
MEIEVSEEKEGPSQYELKDMVETLQKAAEIQSDSKLMDLLQPMLDKKVKAVRSLADLRKLARGKPSKDVETPAEDDSEESELETDA